MAAASNVNTEPASAHGQDPAQPAVDGPWPRGGLLYPQQNHFRNVLDTSGLWQFQLDPPEEGEARGWCTSLPNPRPIAVPCSWNDLFQDARDYVGLAWYQREVHIPSAWRDQRVFLRVGSANYAAKVWMNGAVVAQHLGGHLPFTADVTARLTWESPNIIAISVENKPLPERVPPGSGARGGGVFGTKPQFPPTTYDFFPYAGLHRPVVLYSVPAAAHIDDITVATTLQGHDALVTVTVHTDGPYGGTGVVKVAGTETGLQFRDGAATATVHISTARCWSPADPFLYPLTVTLTDGSRTSDAYTLEIGLRTVAVRGSELLLNGEPIKLFGFGKHEDFPVSGRGDNLPVWIRDYDLLKWVGANSYRTSHYPYAEEAMLLADRLGILVINEIPAVGLNFLDPEHLTANRLTQAQQQLRELVARDKNHPSTIIWSVANEPVAGPPLGLGPQTPEAVESGTAFFRQLHAYARRLDGTRPITMVGLQGGPPEWLGLFDVIAINRYYGWYVEPGQLQKAVEMLRGDLDRLHQSLNKPILITEFGADTLPGAHSTPPEMWTEEYQVEMLRLYLDTLAQQPFVAGTHVWAFADFKTGQSTGRAGGMNWKGVFTRDRRPKMAAHYLRSRWAR
jgi:beta-glucuronidase